jgi:thioredoxin 2
MATSSQIVCPHCGTVNRVPTECPAQAARCGQCHQALFDAHPAAVDERGFEQHV